MSVSDVAEIEYRNWPRDPRYKAGSDGSVIGVRGQVRKTQPNQDGYPCIGVYLNGRHRNVSVHVLVCESWHGPRPAGKQAAHNNGNKQDNRPQNLQWKTPAENEADKRIHGTIVCGEDHPHAKLSSDEVRMIRAEYAAGNVVLHELAVRYGLSRTSVGYIVRGQSWSHVEGAVAGPPNQRGENNRGARLTENDVRAIRRAAAAGTHQRELARQYGVSHGLISHIVSHRNWKHVSQHTGGVTVSIWKNSATKPQEQPKKVPA